MEQTTSRLALTDYLVDLFKRTPAKIIDKVVYLIQGKLRPDYEGVEIGIAEKMALRALSVSSRKKISSVLKVYRKTGDIGSTAMNIVIGSSKSQIKRSDGSGVGADTATTTANTTRTLTVEHVYSTLCKIAGTKGTGSQELKIQYISNLLSNSTLREARYIMKFITNTLRLGIADYTVMDALALAFTGDKSNRTILENAYNVSSDLGTVSKVLATKGIEAVKSIKISLYKPIRPMLAERVRTAQEALDRMGGIAAAEYKLDGERIQVHKGIDGRVELFSRRLEKVTHHYPDIVKLTINALKKIKEVIFEGEVVAIDLQTSQYLPFQELMHRRRKYKVEEAMEQYPVVLNAFDVLYGDRVDKTSLSYSKRRKFLEIIMTQLQKRLKQPKDNDDDYRIHLVRQTIVKNSEQIEKFMASAIENGCDGVMIKDLTSTYKAGAREYQWIKIKREYSSELADTLDLVIVGALYGRGRRAGMYGALLLAAYDHKSDVFRTLSKVGTGFTDKSLKELYRILERYRINHKHPRVDTAIQNMDVWFEPKIVIEVSASEITLSPLYTAGMNSIRDNYGLALRFPKFTGKIREDKIAEDATSVDELISMYKRQTRTIKQ
jgi:DNA ligase-1